MKPNLLIVDDDEAIRSQLRWALADEYNVFSAGDRLLTLELWRQHRFPVVLLDLGLPPRPADLEEGLATLAALLELDRNVKVIIVSGQGEKTMPYAPWPRAPTIFSPNPWNWRNCG